MITYEGIELELDIHGSAKATSVNLLTDQIQAKSILNPDAFARQLVTRLDSERDCAEIIAAIEKSRKRKQQDSDLRDESVGGSDTPHQARQGGMGLHDGTSKHEPTVDKTPTTIAQLMGWGDDHVPAELTASPVIPAVSQHEPKEKIERKKEAALRPYSLGDAAACNRLRPVNRDVTVDVGLDMGEIQEVPAAKEAEPLISPQEEATMELETLVDEAISRLDVCAPRAMTLEMLVTMAKNEWFERRIEKEPGVDRSTLRLPQGDFARKNVVVNFVKHELVFPRYDEVVALINSYDPVVASEDLERLYARWRRAVIDRLCEAFPVLAIAANAQRMRRYDSRTQRLVAI